MQTDLVDVCGEDCFTDFRLLNNLLNKAIALESDQFMTRPGGAYRYYHLGTFNLSLCSSLRLFGPFRSRFHFMLSLSLRLLHQYSHHSTSSHRTLHNLVSMTSDL